MISKKMLLSLVVLVLCVPMLSADVVLDEDFDGQAPGTWVNSAWDGTSDKYEVVADTGDIFGAGTDNQVLRLAPMGGVSGSINIPDAAIVTLSFDFYHVAADGGTPFGAIQFQPYGTSTFHIPLEFVIVLPPPLINSVSKLELKFLMGLHLIPSNMVVKRE